MDKIGECRGDRGGNVYHVYDGYFYRINHNDTVRKYLACVKKSCPGRASMPAAIEDRIINNFKMTGLHNHRPNLHRIALSKLKETLISRSESELTPLKQIYDEEICKVPEEVAEMLRYRVYRSTMQRVRKLVQNAIMNVLQEEAGENPGSETEYAEYAEMEDESGEFTYLEDRPELAVNSKRKRAGLKNSLEEHKKSGVKKIRSVEHEDQIPFEAMYFEEEEPEEVYDYAEDIDYDYADVKEELNVKKEEDQHQNGEVYYKDEEVSSEDQEIYFEDENAFENGNTSYPDEENNYSNFYVENEVEILTSEVIMDSKNQSASTNSPKKNTSHLKTNNTEEIIDDIQEYLKQSKAKPNLQNTDCGDLLSTFFRDVEETVRSFLPSVIIEAKGKIANLVNRLEMRNWQVQQLLKEKEKQKQKMTQQAKQKLTNQKQQPTQLKQLPGKPTQLQQQPTKPTQLKPLPPKPTQLQQQPTKPTQLPTKPTQLQQQPTKQTELKQQPTQLQQLPTKQMELQQQPTQQQQPTKQQQHLTPHLQPKQQVVLQTKQEVILQTKQTQQQPTQIKQENQSSQPAQIQVLQKQQSPVQQQQKTTPQEQNSTNVVVKLRPNVTLISRPNTSAAQSTPVIKVREISSLQDPDSKS